jgi:hypothetical protein
MRHGTSDDGSPEADHFKNKMRKNIPVFFPPVTCLGLFWCWWNNGKLLVVLAGWMVDALTGVDLEGEVMKLLVMARQGNFMCHIFW